MSGKKLLVVIPALNEAATVGWLVRRIPRNIPGISQLDVVVVDDGSSDGTGEAAELAGAEVIRHSDSKGVGVVFHKALDLVVEKASDILVFMDGDGQFNPNDIPRLTRPILEGEADCVTASRYHPTSPPHRQSLAKRIGNRGMAKLVTLLVGRTVYDSACGFRAYSSKAAMSFNLSGKFTYTQEVLLEICFKGLRIVEIPIRVRSRKHGKSRVARSLLKYGMQASTILLRAYRDYQPLRFFGLITVIEIVAATGLGAFFLTNYLQTGRFTPHLWSGFLAGFLFLMGSLTLLTGVLADMLDRIRLSQDKILFHERLRRYEKNKAALADKSVGPPLQAIVSDRNSAVPEAQERPIRPSEVLARK